MWNIIRSMANGRNLIVQNLKGVAIVQFHDVCQSTMLFSHKFDQSNRFNTIVIRKVRDHFHQSTPIKTYKWKMKMNVEYFGRHTYLSNEFNASYLFWRFCSKIVYNKPWMVCVEICNDIKPQAYKSWNIGIFFPPNSMRVTTATTGKITINIVDAMQKILVRW